MSSKARRAMWPVILVGTALTSCVGVCVGFPCFPTGVRYGLWVDTCPATDMRLGARLNAAGLARGDDTGTVELYPWAQWLQGDGADAWVDRGELSRGVTSRFELRRGDDVMEGFSLEPRSGEGYRYKATLPELADGDYTLVAMVDAGFDQAEVSLPLAMYAPAIVHVASDRPLYKPGQTVQLRSAVIRRSDGEPLDDRPGRWTVTAPDGTEMLVEKSKGGPWGVASTTFPLSSEADHGTWRARYLSGSDADEISFTVRPFQLPRMSIEAEGGERWFGIGDEVVLSGRVTYASGAPVRNAAVSVQLRVSEGRWPIPLAWEEPQATTTLPDGTFELSYGEVPADLMELSKVSAWVQAVDETGEVVTGGASLVLSVDDLKVSAVTELGDGLVQGFNNRAYIRAESPDGKPLANTELVLSRPYDPSAPALTTTTDEDGVAALQIDPGAPVTVVDPAPPVRVRPLTPTEPQLIDATELGTSRSLSLPERRVIDQMSLRVSSCGVLTVGNTDRTIALRVAPNGVPEVIARDDVVSQCLAGLARSLRFATGERRTIRLSWRVPDSLQPSLSWSTSVAVGSSPSSLEAEIQRVGLAARRCFPRGSGVSGARFASVHWAIDPGQTRIRADVDFASGDGLPARARGCLSSELGGLRLDKPAEVAASGVSVARLNVPRPPGHAKPQATTRTAYELAVEAVRKGKSMGETRLVVGVGSIPALRMRATPSLAKPGDTVEVALYRGPSFSGTLPKELWLRHEGRNVVKAKVEEKVASFVVPADVEGFAEVQYSGARAVIYVAPTNPLAVTLTTDKPVYRPGDEAQLTVKTTAGEAGSPAAVLLAGVDQSLSQLAPLLSADDFGRVTVSTTSPQPAFEEFDAKALTLGRVRGANAAQAAVLRVGQLASVSTSAGYVGGNNEQAPAVEEVLSGNFYRVVGATVKKVRGWEGAAPKGETMQPATMVGLWNEALADLKASKEPAVDGYGRMLTLDVLPQELLEQVDPRVMVADGTRLPEDVVSWTRYVATEVGQ